MFPNNTSLFVILTFFFGTAFFFCLVKIICIRRQIRTMEETLDDIKDGNSNQKILMPSNELIAPLSYKINEIVYAYEEQIRHYHLSDESNRQLMTNLSHDIRTPLTTLIGYLDAANKGIVTGKEYDSYLKTASKKAHALKEYIDTLFDWFKLNSDELIITMEELEITELTRNILKDWIPIFEERALDFEIQIPEKRIMANIDYDGYCRTINNLVQNVISHSKATKIEFTVWKEKENLNIRIRDNGMGVANEDLPYLFDRLYKCDKGRSAKGSGLGLSVVKQIVEKMGGSIVAESRQEEYTAFTISLPIILLV